MTNKRKARGIIKGYIKGVALNKILLLNHYWPFILKTPLNADLTIGIDVKNKVAGFTFIYKTGADIRFFTSESDDKEQLSKSHIKSKLLEFLTEEGDILDEKRVKQILIHRQGRVFMDEIEGINEALKSASKKGLIDSSYSCSIANVQQTSVVPLRLFGARTFPDTQKEIIGNPTIGTYIKLNQSEAFLCNTGYPYQHSGTTKPIHVVKIDGPMPFDKILEDIFFLANLTWTKIDDCCRDPLSIKMNDIRLREIAGDYDADAYRFVDEESGGAENE